jgi:predicted  nucleic acid-binding Zn-ribbon protein
MDVLRELVVVDEEIRKLDQELGKEREALESVKSDLTRVRGIVEKQRAQYELLENDRGSRIQEARVLGQQLERSREKLSRARNEKETNAVQREIEETRKLLRDVEDAVGKRMIELDELKKGILENEEQEASYVARIGAVEGATSERLRDIETARGERAGVRAGIANRLPQTVLRKYDQIRTKRQTGAARLEGGRCTACNIHLPPQLATRIVRGDVLSQCPSPTCNRLLFVDVAATSPSLPPQV